MFVFIAHYPKMRAIPFKRNICQDADEMSHLISIGFGCYVGYQYIESSLGIGWIFFYSLSINIQQIVFFISRDIFGKIIS